jgi:hypothetical protein
MTDISVRTEQHYSEDRSWLADSHGTGMTRGVTLDLALFTESDHYPDGHLRSGLVLGIVTTSGLAGPYDDAATDGREDAIGHLFTSVAVRDSSIDVGAAVLDHGAVVEGNLPANHGLDAAAKADLPMVAYR